jgi:hypothetical protein
VLNNVYNINEKAKLPQLSEWILVRKVELKTENGVAGAETLTG